MTDAERACPSCGASNVAARELCGACGVDLDSGRRLPAPLRNEAPDPPTSDRATIEHHRWVVPLLGVGIAVVLLLVGLTWAGFGPLATGPDVPAAEFVPQGYTTDPGPLRVGDIATRTSSGPDGAPSGIADGDPATAWRSEGSAGDEADVHDTIDLGLPAPAWIERLRLRNGDHADAEAYEATSRLARIRVVFDGGEVVLADLLDLGLEEQELVLPEPRLTTELRVEILEVFSGEDTSIALAELALLGWQAEGPDVALAEERRSADPATGGPTPLGGISSRR